MKLPLYYRLRLDLFVNKYCKTVPEYMRGAKQCEKENKTYNIASTCTVDNEIISLAKSYVVEFFTIFFKIFLLLTAIIRYEFNTGEIWWIRRHIN